MARVGFAGFAGVTALVGVALAAATPPAQPLGTVAPGLWEIAGLGGSPAPVRQCVGDAGILAQLEHRAKKCSRKILSSSGSSTLVDYSCGGRDFGRSTVTLLTPRSLRIQTQGISDGLPFNYVLQARRAGDCPNKAPAAAH